MLSRVELFFGEATDTQCRIYARAPRDTSVDDLRLMGTISGPQSMYAQTLPATFSFSDRGPGPTLLAEVILPDPCFWTPETPQLYQVNIELHRAGDVVVSERRMFGIRRLGVQGDN
jgi:hypothetical protein